MNAIIGFTDILEKTNLSPEQREYLNAIKVSGDSLLVIINDILDFSRIRSGKMPIERKDFRLSKIVATCIELMQPKVNEKSLALTSHIDMEVPDNLIGDPTRLIQVLLNLTANAIKFTNKGGVDITVHKLQEENNSVKLQFLVKDTGIGIPPDQLETIFDAFTQVNNETARVYGGTGLGIGVGSCFDFTVEYAVSTGIVNTIDEEEPPIAIKNIKVLLAEDNVMNQLLAKKVLSDWGCEVEIADSGEKAIEILQQRNFDVVLMDILLPKMDGYEATKYIRSNLGPPKNAIPIIAMTAYAMQGEQEKCFKAGMNGYVSKPFNAKTLYLNIYKALKKVG
jgi:CheY-like chemotaxis protein/anti-sigma regulatory factor (Ser/Thr protein kinase)